MSEKIPYPCPHPKQHVNALPVTHGEEEEEKKKKQKSHCEIIGSLYKRSLRVKSLLLKISTLGIDKVSEHWFPPVLSSISKVASFVNV